MEDRERRETKEEKIGLAVANITWYLFALKLILVVSAIAVLPVYLMERPLWIAPAIGFAAYFLFVFFWRLVWRLFWRFMEWIKRP